MSTGAAIRLTIKFPEELFSAANQILGFEDGPLTAPNSDTGFQRPWRNLNFNCLGRRYKVESGPVYHFDLSIQDLDDQLKRDNTAIFSLTLPPYFIPAAPPCPETENLAQRIRNLLSINSLPQGVQYVLPKSEQKIQFSAQNLAQKVKEYVDGLEAGFRTSSRGWTRVTDMTLKLSYNVGKDEGFLDSNGFNLSVDVTGATVLTTTEAIYGFVTCRGLRDRNLTEFNEMLLSISKKEV